MDLTAFPFLGNYLRIFQKTSGSLILKVSSCNNLCKDLLIEPVVYFFPLILENVNEIVHAMKAHKEERQLII